MGQTKLSVKRMKKELNSKVFHSNYIQFSRPCVWGIFSIFQLILLSNEKWLKIEWNSEDELQPWSHSDKSLDNFFLLDFISYSIASHINSFVFISMWFFLSFRLFLSQFFLIRAGIIRFIHIWFRFATEFLIAAGFESLLFRMLLIWFIEFFRSLMTIIIFIHFASFGIFVDATFRGLRHKWTLSSFSSVRWCMEQFCELQIQIGLMNWLA